MAVSFFDHILHEFKCPNPKCGEPFKEALRGLLHVDEVVCPNCRTTIDIREAKRTGQIGKDFDTASELDKKIGKEQ